MPNTETELTADYHDVRAFAKELLEICDEVEKNKQPNFVTKTFEQSTNTGPWGLKINIVEKTYGQYA